MNVLKMQHKVQHFAAAAALFAFVAMPLAAPAQSSYEQHQRYEQHLRYERHLRYEQHLRYEREHRYSEHRRAEHEQTRSDHRHHTAAKVIGGSAAAGAVIGAIAGGGKGALIGGAIGAGGGVVANSVRKQNDVRNREDNHGDVPR